MPLNITLNAFPFRHRSKPSHSSSEDETDESSPERGQPHIPATKHGRKSGECLVSITDNGRVSRGPPEKMIEETHIALILDKAHRSNHLDRQTKIPTNANVVSSSPDASHPACIQPSAKPTLIRRVASKLNISIPRHTLHSRPSSRNLACDARPSTPPSRPPRVTPPISSTLPNSFVGKEYREAALRERGLLPPRKDLSEQEREADKRITCVTLPPTTAINGPTEAERLKARWLSNNSTSESSDSDCGPHFISGSPMSSAPSNMDDSRRSCEGKVDLSMRPSTSSSVNALSASSHLEVLHEDPSEEGPLTPAPPPLTTDLPIIVSSSLEDEFLSPLESIEKPVSSHVTVPSSVFDSRSHLDVPPPVPEKDSVRGTTLSASRLRTTDSVDRRRKAVGPTLSRLGTSSLSNLRRSVAGSLGLPDSNAVSATEIPSSLTPFHLALQSQRIAVSPTIHSRGSILLEMRDIEDAESRRLSELAFLD